MWHRWNDYWQLSYPCADLGSPKNTRQFGNPEFAENRYMKVTRLSVLRTGLLYSQEIVLVLISFRGWVDLRIRVRPEGLSQWKIAMNPPGIKPATFRLVAQCLIIERDKPKCSKKNFSFPICSKHLSHGLFRSKPGPPFRIQMHVVMRTHGAVF